MSGPGFPHSGENSAAFTQTKYFSASIDHGMPHTARVHNLGYLRAYPAGLCVGFLNVLIYLFIMFSLYFYSIIGS